MHSHFTVISHVVVCLCSDPVLR